jgi:preprotein translocase subunit YajC
VPLVARYATLREGPGAHGAPPFPDLPLELSAMPPAAQLLVILLVLVFFWVIVMRPARNQQRRVQQLQRGLEVGQEVVLSSGIFGTIRSLTDGRAELEIAPGTVITVARQAVVRTADSEPDYDEPADELAEDPLDTPVERPLDSPFDSPAEEPRGDEERN